MQMTSECRPRFAISASNINSYGVAVLYQLTRQ
jgi:hypothetical protein